MPKLLMFLPCERAIISQDNFLSLISVMESITTQVPVGTTVPENAVAPLQWSVATLWQHQPEDNGRQYEQRVQLVLPNGNQVAEVALPFEMAAPLVRNVATIRGFPISQPGDCSLVLSLRRAGGEWEEIAAFPLTVVHTSAPLPSDGDSRLSPA